MASSIGVVGDLAVDWAMLRRSGPAGPLQVEYLWDRAGDLELVSMPGGAAFVASLLGRLGQEVVTTPLPATALVDPACSEVTRTFTSWSTFREGPGSREVRWRLAEFLGQEPGYTTPRPPDVSTAGVLVVDDANHGFRDDRAAWKPVLDALAPGTPIVAKLAFPLAAGPLWQHLLAMRRSEVLAYLPLSDLRKEDAAAGDSLSWERLASEVVDAIRGRPDLRDVRATIVGIGLAGAVVVQAAEAHLVFDPAHLEGDWEAGRPGLPFGTGSVIAASLAAGIAQGDSRSLAEQVGGALDLARRVHAGGLGRSDDGPRQLAELQAEGGATDFVIAPIPDQRTWTVLAQRGEGNLGQLARDILVDGFDPVSLALPVGRVGAWCSVDRPEIESLRSIRTIIQEYLQQSAKPRPLSIAVFGPPGSGKSFAVKQMAAEWATSGLRTRTLEFNVSQFADESALPSAFQLIRDCAVDGELPLVFWDEFDSGRDGHELGWLARFLAPMQDGTFLDHGMTRPIGAALFVFAGGTHTTMQGFKARATQLPVAKATDFMSRLRGYIDIVGPNRSDEDDYSFLLRRALLLRQILLRRAPQLVAGARLNIDPGVATAFLEVNSYVHGARSMEAIVEMSTLAGRSRFARSGLPARHQLSLHVDPDEFMALVERASAQTRPESGGPTVL